MVFLLFYNPICDISFYHLFIIHKIKCIGFPFWIKGTVNLLINMNFYTIFITINLVFVGSEDYCMAGGKRRTTLVANH
jgi:hypothetical protein